jgi:GTP diphosphokinase / guanosine-3',5'-bis(diphosphate) 3'-diphosphatase
MTEAARPNNPRKKRAESNPAPGQQARVDSGNSGGQGEVAQLRLAGSQGQDGSRVSGSELSDEKAQMYSLEAIGRPLIAMLDRFQDRPAEYEKIIKAYEYAFQRHKGQNRKSDEPYIIHPVEVSILLANLNADVDTICSGLLHDVIEDCEVKAEEIELRFGASVRRIVEGVTKLGKFSFSSKEERQAENFRKLLVAISEDVRVVLVKLADRLHNMRTLDHMSPAKQTEIAQETLEIYAPLANRFGLGRFKWELEDISLKYLYPEEYQRIESLVAESRQERESYVNDVVDRLQKELAARNIQAEVSGRPKHLFGIWKKMKKQGKDFEELYDVFAVRVITESVEEKDYCELPSDPDTQKCYEVMGLVHSLFRPIPGRFKDYIAMPKANSYQSLHTAVMGLSGRPVEIQIRTRTMHHVAEFGIAAHWRYKESGSVVSDSQVDRKLSWLRQLVEWQQDLKDAREYMDTVKMDLFADEVFVFSPRGDVFDLPKGSTPIDFAYRVHTEIGNHVTGARVNERMVPLATPLQNGDIVEIITSKNAHPRMDWLNVAATNSAKSRIRQWFKKHHREEHIQQGRQMLEAELGKANFEELLRSDRMKELGKRLNVSEPEDILAALGYGDISMSQVINRIREQDQQQEKERKKESAASEAARAPKSGVPNLSGLMHHLAQCCNPVPGDSIAGVVTRGSGITVHRTDCVNLSKVEKDRHMELTWPDSEESHYPAYLVVECLDRVGIARDILQKILDNKINLSDLRVETHPSKSTATIHLIVDVRGIQQLDLLSAAIKNISDVHTVQRQNHRRAHPISASYNISEISKSKKEASSKREHKKGRRAKSGE